VHDGNSGGHVTQEHPRSIAGCSIVDPGSASFAQRARGTLGRLIGEPARRSQAPFDPTKQAPRQEPRRPCIIIIA
jgi:hypothetical protein